jgi:hypothetical protein
MRIHAINAFEGDCLLIETGGADNRFALVDGGPRGAFNRHLGNYLTSVIGEDGTLDAVVVSHVDGDHITGVLDLLADIEARKADDEANVITVRDLWHNSFARTLDNDRRSLVSNLQSMMSLAGRAQVAAANGSIALLGISQGERLRRMALKLGIPVNQEFGGELISTDLADGSWSFGDAEFSIAGPTAANLEELRLEWARWIEDNLDAFADGDPMAMANADKSIPNLSSIVLFGTTPDGDVLLTGDARGDHILDGLEQSGVIAAGGSHHFRLIKVQHHGSNRNVDEEFIRRLTADIYLISADGKHGNPDLGMLTMLADALKEQNRTALIVITNEPQSVTDFRSQRAMDEYGYELAIRDPGNHAIIIDLATGTVS